MILGRRSVELFYEAAYNDGHRDGVEHCGEAVAVWLADCAAQAQREVKEDSIPFSANQVYSIGDPGDACGCGSCNCESDEVDEISLVHLRLTDFEDLVDEQIEAISAAQVTNVTVLLEQINALGQRVEALETKPKRKTSTTSRKR